MTHRLARETARGRPQQAPSPQAGCRNRRCHRYGATALTAALRWSALVNSEGALQGLMGGVIAAAGVCITGPVLMGFGRATMRSPYAFTTLGADATTQIAHLGIRTSLITENQSTLAAVALIAVAVGLALGVSSCHIILRRRERTDRASLN